MKSCYKRISLSNFGVQLIILYVEFYSGGIVTQSSSPLKLPVFLLLFFLFMSAVLEVSIHSAHSFLYVESFFATYALANNYFPHFLLLKQMSQSAVT